ncbi:MAG: glycoside hydrolase family 43 protein [Lachnospiraceae bacterium]|nr:glycoside hydrolase family 43 protein [Lachnospiraceae bacterium]
MRKKSKVFAATLAIAAMLLAACGKEQTGAEPTDVPEVTQAPEPTATSAPTATPEPTKAPEPTEEPEPTPKPLEEQLAEMTLSETLKKFGTDTPLMTQRFGADPCALVYDGRVYIYMTADTIEYSYKTPKDNSYSKINTLNVISSDDLVNWTDHGSIYAAGRDGAAKWGGNSWAPAAACKEIDGQMKFFLYFANGGNGIGVLTADSPTGPFKDPIGKALISRSTPNCGNVDWLFDPAVLMDDDGSAYIYFGGGVPAGKAANPGTGRVAKLGDDMISLATEPVAIDIPYLFEDSGINKVGDTYVYSYCTNWNVSAEATKEYGFTNANIAYMISDNPMGPFTYEGVVLKHPGSYFAGDYNNNHHAIFEFNGEWYITYHTRILAAGKGVAGLNYRSTHITKLNLNEEGLFETVKKADCNSLVQQKYLNPFEQVEAETMATMGGLDTTQEGMISKTYGSGNMVLTDIQTGDWAALYGVDFGETGATKFTVSVKAEKGTVGAIQIRLDEPEGEVVGCLEIGKDADGKNYQEITAELSKTVTGVHNLIFVFCGEDYTVDYWQFQ